MRNKETYQLILVVKITIICFKIENKINNQLNEHEYETEYKGVEIELFQPKCSIDELRKSADCKMDLSTYNQIKQSFKLNLLNKNMITMLTVSEMLMEEREDI